jgi:hypothetical protein
MTSHTSSTAADSIHANIEQSTGASESVDLHGCSVHPYSNRPVLLDAALRVLARCLQYEACT